MAKVWLIIAAIMFIGELVCPIFFLFWFAIGALAALLTSLFTSSLTIQILVFLIVSIALVIFMKPLTNKFFKNNTKDEMNMNGIIGKNATVTKTINNINGAGEVKVHGEIWSAISDNDNEVIEKESKVEILKIDGVKLVVKKVIEHSEINND